MTTGVPPSAEPAAAPRLRGTRPGTLSEPLAPDENEPDIIAAGGVRWINIEHPREADSRLAGGALRLPPARSRTSSRATSGRSSTSTTTTCSSSCTSRCSTRTPGRLLTAELDLFVGPDYLITLPEHAAAAARGPVRALPREGRAARGPLLEGLRLPALQDRRHLRRRLVPDAAQDGRSSSSGSRTTSSRAAPSEIVRDISNAKQEIINFRKIVRPQRAVLRDLERTSSATSRKSSRSTSTTSPTPPSGSGTSLENYKEVVEALESTERVGPLAPPERLVPRPDRDQRRRSCR